MNWSIPARKAMTGLIYWLGCPLLVLAAACALFDSRALQNGAMWLGATKLLLFFWFLRQVVRFAVFFARRRMHIG